MKDEYQSIMKNESLGYSTQTKKQYCGIFKWVYKIKHVGDGSIQKYKAIFVARGFCQKQGIDYEEIFSLVARYNSIRTIIAISSMMKWDIHQMDVNTTFLNGVIEEEVYIE